MAQDSGRYHLPGGSCQSGAFEVEVTPALAGWTYASLRVLNLAPGGRISIETGPEEMLVLPLTGACEVSACGRQIGLEGRPGVFSRVTDFAYVPRDAAVTIASESGGRFALPAAAASRRLPVRYGAAAEVPVELRGAGRASRQLNNFCAPDAFDCDKLVAVEALTPGGNWSSYPPHKHDSQGPGEAVLEEIYYFELAEADRRNGLGYQRVYSSGPDHEIDVLAEVRSGDAVLVPHGYHGPSMAAPAHDMYYLNVLAGPAAQRTMAFCDDPNHAWIRDTWRSQAVDPRLPLTSVAAAERA
jgi:5-deoxy-glucuronate isomerase